MRRLLAIVLCLVVTLQSVVAMARPVQLCCAQGPCSQHDAACLAHACQQGSAAQAVLPAMPRLAVSIISASLPMPAVQRMAGDLLADIWRPPPSIAVHQV